MCQAAKLGDKWGVERCSLPLLGTPHQEWAETCPTHPSCAGGQGSLAPRHRRWGGDTQLPPPPQLGARPPLRFL